jgi:hypothetical protein
MATLTGDYKTSDLLNAIKTDASAEYQSRIPTATKDNLAEVGTAILEYSATRNEFANALMNRIAKVIISSKMYQNPLREFKRGMLEFGETIEDVFVDIVKAQAFNPDLASEQVFKRAIPNILSVFHKVNRQDFYKTTVQRQSLQKAFLGETGLERVIDGIVQSLYTSDALDEFLIMKNLIHQYGVEGKFNMQTISPVTDEATAKAALSKIKEISNDMCFMKSDYNYANIHTHTSKEDQIVLISTKFDALVDVEVLASAFNMDKADFIGRRVLIDDFGGLDNVLCAVVDKNWFMVHDTQFLTDDIFNPEGLYINYFLHHWQIMSVSPFFNAVLFVTVAPTIDAIAVYPDTATVAKGGSLQLTTEATGTGNPSSKCTFAITGNTDTKTVVSTNGLVYIGADEVGTVGDIVVTATSVIDATKTDTCTITIV